MPTVLLMRSGRTAWEAEGRIQGSLDIPVSPEGVKEVELRAKDIMKRPIGALVCGSDLPAFQTAQILERICKARAKVVEELREIRLGVWEGLLEQEAARRNPTAYRFWRKDPLSVSPPGGESAEDCHRRVSKALKRLVGDNGERVVVLVCSRLVAAVIHCVTKDVPISRLWEYVMPPAAVEQLQLR